MKLYEYLEYQNRLLNKIFSPEMRHILNFQKALIPPKIEMFMENSKKLSNPEVLRFLEVMKITNDSIRIANRFTELLPIKETLELTMFTSALIKINNFSNADYLNISNNLAFQNFDFLDIIEFDEEKIDEENAPSKETIVISETHRIKKIIKDIYIDNEKLLQIHSREFEKVIAELLSHQGFDVELTKQTRDNGYDIIALKYFDGHIPLKFLVECKRYTKEKVGVEIIRAFKEVLVTENANRGIIVTTSYFTKDAVNKRNEMPYLLDYRDKDHVMEWVKNYAMNIY